MKRILSALAVSLVPSTALAADKIKSQTGFTNFAGVVEALYSALIVFIPAVATIYLGFAGYRYMVAQGNQDLTEKAKRSLTYAVFGLIIAYSSVAIMLLVANQLGFTFKL